MYETPSIRFQISLEISKAFEEISEKIIKESTVMITPILRRQLLLQSGKYTRCFSSSPVVSAAAEVRRLGVIGAGQMVINNTNPILPKSKLKTFAKTIHRA